MTTDMQKDIDALKEELQQWIIDNPGLEPNDYIFELADGGVPVYTYDILIYALENINFATDEPELGPAFDGTPTPINIIAANIFEYIEQELWSFYNEHRNDACCDNCKEIFDAKELTECYECNKMFCDGCLDVCWSADDEMCLDCKAQFEKDE